MAHTEWNKPRKTIKHLETKHKNNLVVGFHDGSSKMMHPHYSVTTPHGSHYYTTTGKKVRESSLMIKKPKKKRGFKKK